MFQNCHISRERRRPYKFFLQIFAQALCEKRYLANRHQSEADLPHLFRPEVFCAGLDTGGAGSCPGDSGGPLVVYTSVSDRYVQVGVVHGTAGRCGDRNFPDIYSRLSDERVLDFVRKVVGLPLAEGDDGGGDGGWSPWSAWSGCSRTCGGGTRRRTRECEDPLGGCQGSGGGRGGGGRSQTEHCSEQPCKIVVRLSDVSVRVTGVLSQT